MRRRIFSTLLTLCFGLAGIIPVLSQVDVSSATIKGSVTDPNGAAIPATTITATSVDKGISKSTKTGADG
jgi:hypothetical protein